SGACWLTPALHVGLVIVGSRHERISGRTALDYCALNSHPGFGTAALLGAILGAAYMLSFIHRAFFGQS
ncbi:MAG TPA: hypothetical protein VFI43_09100, partial [Nitrosospira sp.]|nr:hypothetical protein [Nitrosospira sp.]